MLLLPCQIVNNDYVWIENPFYDISQLYLDIALYLEGTKNAFGMRECVVEKKTLPNFVLLTMPRPPYACCAEGNTQK